MIKVKYNKTYLEVTGHANSNIKGHDLVCAAVSAIVQTAQSWFKKGELAIKISRGKEVTLRYDLIKKTTENEKKLNLVVLQLQELAKRFKKYIKIKKGK